ncbi:hypothetical protein KPH14_011990 [Odynerus spinipes]|uniref:Peptidase M3A/M3B catalytic domain-containing protein n=1 Tax=Odynerus spinipes TaxID=1348599 RepID=A0AAD9RC99_9HYME|nr:hypothetical protein KPH14_011990 [Odynerus spinipes]
MVFSFCVKRFLLSRNNGLKIPKRNGYIVLLPEIGEECPEGNLLKEDKTPEFNNITIEKCIAAIRKQAIDCDKRIEKIEAELQNKKDIDVFNDVLLPLEETYVPLGITWGIAQALYYGNQTLIPTKSFIGISLRAMNAIRAKYSSTPIYEACKRLKGNKNISLTSQQERILHKYTLEGRFNGLELSEKKKEWLIYCHKILHLQEDDFVKKLQEARKHCSYTIHDENVVKDFPEELLEATAADPTQPYVGPWTIRLQEDILNLFLEYCSNRGLRWKMWETDATLLAPSDDKQFQTNIILGEVYFMHKQQAHVFGYKSYAHMSMETKMAKSLDDVYNTFDILLQSARPAQQLEIETLTEFAQKNGLEGPLKPWDILYWNRKYHENIYKFKEESLKDYFPLLTVLNGLFNLLKVKFGIHVVENKKVDIWHKDVSFYDVFNMNISTTEPIANFYLDPYARGEEKPHTSGNSGHVVVMKNRSKLCNTKPMCALIFNFVRPKDEKPSLLSLTNVRTLFQKFGHALHHMTTAADYADISGLSFVEWDAAFIYDYFLENWLYEPSTLLKISGHYETKSALPPEAIEVVEHSRLQLAGYNLCKELLFSRFDLEMYSSGQDWGTVMEKLWKQHFVMPLERSDVYIYSFEPSFSTRLATHYFSYLWSKIIAADLYSAFQEISTEDKTNQEEVCKRYQNTFLALNNTCPTSEIFRRFRGRDPSPQALLKMLKLNRTEQ